MSEVSRPNRRVAISLDRSSGRSPKETPGGDRYIYWLVTGICAILLGAAVLGRDGLLSVIVNQRRLEGLRGEVSRLGEDNLLLRKQIRSLRKDLTSIERIAREDLGLVKPGETVYEFIPAEKPPREREKESR